MTSLFAIALWALLAPGSTAELVDLGPAMGRAGAVAAVADSGAAAYYNPAGLAFHDQLQLRVGVQTLYSQLDVGGAPVGVGAPFSILVEGSTPVPLLEPLTDVLAVGVAVHFLTDTMLGVDAPTSTEPILPYYRNRTQRIVVMPGLAIRPHRYFAVGAGLNYFSGSTGLANVTEGTDGRAQADVDQEITAAATAHAGARWQSEHLSVGVAFRQHFAVAFNTASQSYIADSGIDLAIRARALYTPETWVFAVAWREERFDLAVDVSFRRWSRWAAPFAHVVADAPLPSFSDAERRLITASDFDKPKTRDIWRLAFSGHGDLLEPGAAGALAISAGYAYEPSAFVFEGNELEQNPINVIDGAKHIVGLGLSWRAPDLGRARFTVDLAGQLHYMGTIRLAKDPTALPDEEPDLAGRQTTNAGYPSLSGGGWLLAGMASLTFELLPAVAEAAP